MKQIILVLALLTIALAKYEALRELDQIPYGRSIIDALQISLQSGEPIDRFTDIIHKVEDMYNAEQKSDDARMRVDEERCDNDLKEIGGDNNLLVARLTGIQTSLDDMLPLLSRKQTILSAKQMWLADLLGKVAELVAARNDEATVYKSKTDEHDYAQFVIETVKHMFGEKQVGFLQVEESVASVETLKKVAEQLMSASEQAGQFIHKKSYSNFFKLMAQVAVRVEQGNSSMLVQRIMGLCDQLLKNIDQSRLLENKAELRRINDFNRQNALLQKDVTKINNTISQLLAEMTQLSDQITVAQRDYTDTSERQANKQKQVDDRTSECDEGSLLYKQARDQRLQNREIASQILGIVHANQRDFVEYVRLRTAAGDFEGQQFDVLGQ